ncbi:MAG: hypothetical protein M0R06_20165 [Sphaerochaeta sp.]|jgi:hypothetical protein|nr:hypothetical protein [Sphaerochaeta sp.]
MTDETQITVADDAKDYLDKAGDFQIIDADTERAAMELYAKCDTVVKDIEAKRKAKTAPLNDIVKEINAAAKVVSAPFVEAMTSLKKKASDWRTSEAVMEAESERRRLEKEAFHRANNDDLDGALEANDKALAIAEEVPKTVKTDEGTIRYRTDYVIDGVDMEELHERFVIVTKTANEKEIKACLKAGEDIKGVKFHVERTPINYRN